MSVFSSNSSSDDGAAVPIRKSGRFGCSLKVLAGQFFVRLLDVDASPTSWSHRVPLLTGHVVLSVSTLSLFSLRWFEP